MKSSIDETTLKLSQTERMVRISQGRLTVIYDSNYGLTMGFDKSKPVTYRNMRSYRTSSLNTCPPDFEPRPEKTYMEIGAGLGEFVPYIVRELGEDLINKPVVIDPLDYRMMISLLEKTNEFVTDEKTNKLILELIDRANIITNPDLVQFYNITLEEALKVDELKHSADLVVDMMGGAYYTPYETGWGDGKASLAEFEQSWFLKSY